MNKIKYLIILTLVLGFQSSAQTGSLTSSPYSLFGLGVESNSNTGINSSLGKTGTSLSALNGINLYNSASFATIPEKKFVFDFGLSAELLDIYGEEGKEQKTTYNFSNLSIGFNSNGKYGMGLTLKRATNIGYSLTGIQSNIEGSNEQFTTNIIGSGGLNEVRFDYGRKLKNTINLGIKASYLFGKIEETESILTSTSYLDIYEENYYNGVQIGLGLQYNFMEKYNFGLTIDLPTVLKGTKDVVIGKYSNLVYTLLEETEGESIDSFYLPLKLGFGFNTSIKNLLLTADYNKSFWSATNQSDSIGDYSDQTIFSLGASYKKNPLGLKYWQRIDFRAGLNYNSGYLKVNNTKIDTYGASIGLGLPIGKQSFLNISYTLSKKGTTKSILIKEYSNTLNINFTLSDSWFQKRKYN